MLEEANSTNQMQTHHQPNAAPAAEEANSTNQIKCPTHQMHPAHTCSWLATSRCTSLRSASSSMRSAAGLSTTAHRRPREIQPSRSPLANTYLSCGACRRLVHMNSCAQHSRGAGHV